MKRIINNKKPLTHKISGIYKPKIHIQTNTEKSITTNQSSISFFSYIPEGFALDLKVNLKIYYNLKEKTKKKQLCK